MPTPRSLSEILAAHGDAVKNDIRKVLPATVTAVHLDRQTVDVQIAINNPLYDDLGNVITEPAASISDVPLGIIRGGGFMVWLPPAVGDSVLLVFSDLSADTWRAGTSGQPLDPGFVGKHTLDSPFAMPMVAPDASFFTDPGPSGAGSPTAGKVIIGKDGSPAQIRISATDIELGNNAMDAVALASLVASELGKIKTALGSLTCPNSGTGPIAVTATTPYSTVGTVASTLVKAQ